MIQQKFKVGEVVMLKSGGPEMTIQEAEANHDWVKCTWFHDSKRYNDHFHQDTVELVGSTASGIDLF